ncbi:MAG TPA: hypothetical protein PLM06_02615, partial [Anaerolineae bacterium]|nr:hypothetical protein [Anaerolineae bacterium]
MSTLEIGGISLTLRGPEDWLAPLDAAWATWNGPEPGMPVQILPDATLPAPAGPYFEARPRFADGVCYLEAPGFAGVIALAEGKAALKAHPAATASDLSYFVRTVMALAAFEQGALLVHGAGIVHHDVAYILYGLSGSGKST